jgi:formate dehydrogenase major subunit
MDLTRRQFLTGSALATGGAVGATKFGFDMAPAYAQVRGLKILRATETRSVCPYCAVGCSMIAYSMGDKSLNSAQSLIHIEGDPDSPINGGTLCPKGASTLQLALNGNRGQYPMYRAAGASEWTRQTGFAFLGGATISNEEGYLTTKLMRGLGTVYIEQQARV